MSKTNTCYDQRSQQNKQFPAGTYTVVKPVNLRDGIAVDSPRIRKLAKGEKVVVAEVISHGNTTRARITSPASGWTSMISSNGFQCLAHEARKVGEKTWEDIKKSANKSGKGVVGMGTWESMKNARSAKASNQNLYPLSNSAREQAGKPERASVGKAVSSKRQMPRSGKTMACPECNTRFDAAWDICPQCNGELASTWKEEGAEQGPEQPTMAKYGAPEQMPQQAAHPQGISYAPNYQIIYQPVFQHMAQPTYQINMSQQGGVQNNLAHHNQQTNMAFPQQMYQAQPQVQPTPVQYVQQPMQQPVQAVPQIQYMAHAPEQPAGLPAPRLVRGQSLLNEAYQAMQPGMQQPLVGQMKALDMNDYINQLEKAGSSSPNGQPGDVFRGASKEELQGVYYPMAGPKSGSPVVSRQTSHQ